MWIADVAALISRQIGMVGSGCGFSIRRESGAHAVHRAAPGLRFAPGGSLPTKFKRQFRQMRGRAARETMLQVAALCR